MFSIFFCQNIEHMSLAHPVTLKNFPENKLLVDLAFFVHLMGPFGFYMTHAWVNFNSGSVKMAIEGIDRKSLIAH